MSKSSEPVIVYQVYLPSFLDTNHDGLGDLAGVTAKLDYLQSIGVTHLWISPFNTSPMRDNGYDVSDFYAVDSRYGMMADFEGLVAAAKKRKIKIVMDIVFNHVSSEHTWFKKAIATRDNAYQKYFWFFDESDPQVKALQTVKSVFNEPILVFVPKIKKYYYATFSKYQPDLNWESPVVRTELAKVIKFWVDKGVGGFRLDVFNMIVKDKTKMLSQVSPWDHAEHDKVLGYWAEVLASAKHLYTVAECNVAAERAIRYTEREHGVVSSVFSFNHFDERDFKTQQGFRFDHFVKAYFDKSLAVNNAGGLIALAFNNHDNPRLLDWAAVKNRKHTSAIAGLLEVLLLFNTAIPFIYQGEEYGMQNPTFKSATELRDIASLNDLKTKSFAEVVAGSRDNARTPMAWDEKSKNFGFSDVTPWLTNAHSQQFVSRDFRTSLQTLIALRKRHWKAMSSSKLKVRKLTSTYLEYEVGPKWVVVINFSPRQRPIEMSNAMVIFSSLSNLEQFLRPFEAKILEIKEHN